jgi:hypothetical protein
VPIHGESHWASCGAGPICELFVRGSDSVLKVQQYLAHAGVKNLDDPVKVLLRINEEWLAKRGSFGLP